MSSHALGIGDEHKTHVLSVEPLAFCTYCFLIMCAKNSY